MKYEYRILVYYNSEDKRWVIGSYLRYRHQGEMIQHYCTGQSKDFISLN